MWLFTVSSEMWNVSAISPFDMPRPIACSISCSRLVSAPVAARVVVRTRRYALSTRAVTDGSSHEPPPATVRTARIRSSAEESLRMKPAAPARSAPDNISSSSNVVSASTGGTGVVVMLGGANRDPAVFAEPHRFDITRTNAAEHLAFSGGVHYCLGASLARQEATIALRALYTRFPGLRLRTSPVRRETRVLRGYRHLPVVSAAPAGTE